MLTLSRWKNILAVALAFVVTTVLSTDIHEGFHEELQFGWKMGLRPRQAAQNLQFFSESVGGVSAPAVRSLLFILFVNRCEKRRLTRVFRGMLDHPVKRPRQAILCRWRHFCMVPALLFNFSFPRLHLRSWNANSQPLGKPARL